MSRYHSYLNSAKEILLSYKADEPFASFIKKYFSGQKKFGSKDRRQINNLCYSYFRLGKPAIQLPPEQQILTGLFLCSIAGNEVLNNLKPEWNERIKLTIEQKLSYLQLNDLAANLFPCPDQLSDGIKKEKFILSHLQQPDFFLRVRPGKEETVKQKLETAGINFSFTSGNCLVLPSASKIDSVVDLNKEAVIQDYSSQQTGELLKLVKRRPSDKVWDCCAGSGGKSIMLYDLNPKTELTVSDIRETILINLKKRFKEAGIEKYKSFSADISSPNFKSPDSGFGLILCDVPCSGSGTWGRTPEQLVFFNERKIDEYASLQKRIIANVIPHLQKGGYFLYITCSVYKKENEFIAEYIKESSGIELLKMETLEGYALKADTMFAALFQKPL